MVFPYRNWIHRLLLREMIWMSEFPTFIENKEVKKRKINMLHSAIMKPNWNT